MKVVIWELNESSLFLSCFAVWKHGVWWREIQFPYSPIRPFQSFVLCKFLLVNTRQIKNADYTLSYCLLRTILWQHDNYNSFYILDSSVHKRVAMIMLCTWSRESLATWRGRTPTFVWRRTYFRTTSGPNTVNWSLVCTKNHYGTENTISNIF